ncbi:hypothetical protein R5R35_010708 [Gryllus longicercus]|uniref:EF-hand domain-containing protein n=1 Tax=Gryllus longicercus TaxID=2509291 RepID=A0AAN9Z1X1_9ORTH
MRPCAEPPPPPPAAPPGVVSAASASAASSGVDPEQLRAVFQLCDPHGTGFVSLHTLLQLGREYCSDHNAQQEVARALQQLDPAGRGVIGFADFCRGVCAVVGEFS